MWLLNVLAPPLPDPRHPVLWGPAPWRECAPSLVPRVTEEWGGPLVLLKEEKRLWLSTLELRSHFAVEIMNLPAWE